MDIVVDGIRLAGFEPGRDVAIAVDVASSHFFDPSRRAPTVWVRARREALDSAGMVELLAGLGRSVSDRLARGRPGGR